MSNFLQDRYNELLGGVKGFIGNVGQQSQNITGGIGNTIMQGLGNVQRFGEGGVKLRIPEVAKARPTDTIQKSLAKGIINTPGYLGNMAISGIVDPLLDVSVNAGRVASGRDTLSYDKLRSGTSKLGYNIMGINRTPNEVMKNIGGTLEPISAFYGGGLAKGALKGAGKEALKSLIKRESVAGLKAGAFQGGVSSMASYQGKNPYEQMLQTGQGALTGGVLGAGAGVALPVLGAGFNKTVMGTKAFKRYLAGDPKVQVKEFNVDDIKVQELVNSWNNIEKTVRNRISTGLSEKNSAILQYRNAQKDIVGQIGQLRRANLQGGFVKPSEFVPKGKIDPTKPVQTPITGRPQVNETLNIKKFSNEGENLITGEIERLKDQVKGVSIIKNNDGTIYRASENADWYRSFFETNGRRPNEKEFREMAISNLTKNDVDGFYSDPEALKYNLDTLKPQTNADLEVNAKPITQEDALKINNITKSEADKLVEQNSYSLEKIDEPLSFEKQIEKQAGYTKLIDETYNKVTERQNKLEGKIKVREIKNKDLENIKFIKKQISKNTRGTIQKEVDSTIPDIYANSLNWKDKPKLLLVRERMDRNFEGVMGKDSQKMKQAYLEPVYKNEADRTRFLLKEKADIKNLGIKAKSDESTLLQAYGEKLITLDQLKAKTKNWEKITKAEQVFRTKYNKYIVEINKALQLNGYDPIPYRKDYFKHFAEIGGALEKFGISKVDNLPTDINGLTADFKPGKNFFSSALPRLGDKTEYDAITGIDKYLQGASSLIYHTSDIKRLRGLEEALRSQHAGTQHLTNFVADLSEYTNNLAGKKSMIDRSAESIVGRKLYSFVDTLRKQTGANMTGLNVASAMTNYIPLTQGLATTDKRDFVKGMLQTLRSVVKDDGFRNQSDFLVKRDGVDPLYRNLWGNIQNKGGFMFKAIDNFTSGTLTRAKYYEGIRKGMSNEQALKYADNHASRIMGDRSLGAVPNLFNSKTLGLLTQFQLEVNNQLSFIFKDIPSTYDKKGMASAITQVFLYSYIFNNLYEKLVGRRPAFDPVGVAFQTYEDYNNDNIDKGKATQNLVSNVSDQLPFASTFTGGRIPIGAGIPNPMAIASGDSNIKKEATKLLYSLPPTGGGQLKKTIEGLGAFNQGASTSDGGRVRYPIPQTATNLVKTAVAGQYSTPEARKYFREGTNVLGENQSATLLAGGDKQMLYNKYISDRELNSNIEKIKADITLNGGYRNLNGKVYYADTNGYIKNIDVNKEIKEPALTGKYAIDKQLVSEYKSSLTARAKEIVKLYQLGVLDADTADKLAGSILLKNKKINSSGKAKKPKKITLKIPKSSKIKVKQVSPSKSIREVRKKYASAISGLKVKVK